MVSRRRLKDAYMLLNLNRSVARNALRALILILFGVKVNVKVKALVVSP